MLTHNRLLGTSSPSTEADAEGPRHLTSSQAAALRRLSDLASLQGIPERAGVAVRNRPLIIGPSGSGKSAIVRRLASLEGRPMMVINASTWIVFGAYTTPHTLTVIRNFIRRHERSVLFIDEIDKFAHGGAIFSSPWALSALAECLAVLDGDGKLGACGWKESDIAHLRKSCFIVGAGAWQLQAAEAREEGRVSYAEQILDQSRIPEEVLFRFNAELIEIALPKEKDFQAAIRRVRTELSLPALATVEEGNLVSQAIGSLRGMRWVEAYLADLLIAHPVDSEPAEETEKEVIQTSPRVKIHLTSTEYQARLDGLHKLMAELQRPVFELETKLRLIQQLASASGADQRPAIPASDYQPLVDSLENYSPALLHATCRSAAERYRRETELHVHGEEVLRHLENWLRDRPYSLRELGLLETAITVRVGITRQRALMAFLASVEIE
jgi:ABC-type Fe3+/spermidine/putrescine transport system ATPase subunit